MTTLNVKKLVEIRRLLVQAVSSALIASQLKESGSRWVAGLEAGLDVAFVDKNHQYVGIDAFGLYECIGVTVKGDETVPEGLDALLKQGAQVAQLSIDELIHWATFYKNAEEYFLRGGPRVRHTNGWGKSSIGSEALLKEQLQVLVNTDVRKRSKTELKPHGLFDLAPLTPKRRPKTLTVFNVRHAVLGELTGVLKETVGEKPTQVPGFVVRKDGETKYDAYARAHEIEIQLNRGRKGSKLVVPVVSQGQLSLWNKLGFLGPIQNVHSTTQHTVADVIRFLYLGTSTLSPGPLAQMDLSLPGTGHEFGLDIVFFRRNTAGHHYFATVDNLAAPDIHQLKKGEHVFNALDNVGGIILVSDGADVEEMLTMRDQAAADFYHRRWGPRFNILFLTETTFRYWLEQGTPFLEKDDATAPKVSRLFTGYGVSSNAQYQLNIWQPRPQIGGNQILLRVSNGDGTHFHIADWGTSFVAEPPGLQDLTSRTTTALGLQREFRTGALPMVPIYEPHYLLASAINLPSLSADNPDPVTKFILATIATDVPYPKLAEKLGKSVARLVVERGRRLTDEMWGVGSHNSLVSIHPTHAHVDHTGMMAELYVEAALYAPAETIAHLISISARASSWKQDVTTISRLTEPKVKGAYQRVYRRMVPLYSNPASSHPDPGLLVTNYMVAHSITGASMVGFTHASTNSPLFLTVGDVRLDRDGFTAQALQHAGGMYPVIVLECTNFEEDKGSAGVTETQVKASLQKLVSQAKGVVVVVIPPNHIQRLDSLLEVAEATGRKVALGPRHAEVVYQMRAMQSACPSETVGFRFKLPQVGDDVSLYVRPLITRRKFEQILIARMAHNNGNGLADIHRLSEEDQSKWIVVLSPFDLLINTIPMHFTIPPTVIYSAPFPYQSAAKYRIGANLVWIKQQNGHFFADFEVLGTGGRVVPKPSGRLHASGHATFPQMIDEILIPLLGNTFSGKTVILIHGEHPVSYATQLKQRLRLNNPSSLRVISRLPNYDPANPEATYFKLPLF